MAKFVAYTMIPLIVFMGFGIAHAQEQPLVEWYENIRDQHRAGDITDFELGVATNFLQERGILVGPPGTDIIVGNLTITAEPPYIPTESNNNTESANQDMNPAILPVLATLAVTGVAAPEAFAQEQTEIEAVIETLSAWVLGVGTLIIVMGLIIVLVAIGVPQLIQYANNVSRNMSLTNKTGQEGLRDRGTIHHMDYKTDPAKASP